MLSGLDKSGNWEMWVLVPTLSLNLGNILYLYSPIFPPEKCGCDTIHFASSLNVHQNYLGLCVKIHHPNSGLCPEENGSDVRRNGALGDSDADPLGTLGGTVNKMILEVSSLWFWHS